MLAAPALVVGAWVLACSGQPNAVARILPAWAPLHVLLVKLPVYAVACAGLYWLGIQLLDRYRARQPAPQVVSRGAAEYPLPNEHPTRIISVSGSLPDNLPVKDLVAVYAARARQPDESRCVRRDNRGPSRMMRPLVVVQHVPIDRQGGRYDASVVADRYIPGYCGWHLKEIRYFLEVEGHRFPDFTYGGAPPHVEVVDPDSQSPAEASNRSLYSGPMDVWCWKTEGNVNPSYPVSCTHTGNGVPGRRMVPLSTPDPERDARGIVYVLPQTTAVTFNFHNVGE